MPDEYSDASADFTERKHLVTRRAVLKRKVSLRLKSLDGETDQANINSCKESIKKFLAEIEEYNSKINETFLIKYSGRKYFIRL